MYFFKKTLKIDAVFEVFTSVTMDNASETALHTRSTGPTAQKFAFFFKNRVYING